MQVYIFATILGLLSGLALNFIARLQVKKRSQDQKEQDFFKKPIFLLLWPLVTALIFNAFVYRMVPEKSVKSLEYILYTLPLINIAAVDALLRKIPNGLLLSILLVRASFIIVELVEKGFSLDILFRPFLGMLLAFIIFSVPARFGAFIGAGDVKFAAVIGFIFGFDLKFEGFMYFFQAMVLMGVLVLIYLLYLLITKKGNLKTATPMGPYLSVGVVLTMLFPLSEILSRFS